jgi:hypothetical protein
VVTDIVREMNSNGMSIAKIKWKLQRNGFKSSCYDGVLKISLDLTTLGRSTGYTAR